MFISCYASGSAGNLYKIENNKTTLLIECGLPMKDIRHCLGTTIDNVEAVLLTHEHKDHSKAIHEFLRLGIDIFIPAKEQRLPVGRRKAPTCILSKVKRYFLLAI